MAGELGKLQTAGGTSCLQPAKQLVPLSANSRWHCNGVNGARLGIQTTHDMRKVVHLRDKNNEKTKLDSNRYMRFRQN